MSGQIHASQLITHERNRHLDDQSTMLSNILKAQHEIQRLLKTAGNSSMPSPTPEPGSSTDVIDIRAYIPNLAPSSYSSQCRCACHFVKSAKSSHLLHRLTGTLFVGYSGHPGIKVARKNLAGPLLFSKPIFIISFLYGF